MIEKILNLERLGGYISGILDRTLYPKNYIISELSETHHLSNFLPYQWYDSESELFITDKHIGFILETAPLVGNSEAMQKELSNIFTQVLPEGSSIQTMIYADKNIDGILSEYINLRSGSSETIQALAVRRANYLSKLAIKSHLSPYVLRDFKCYLSVCINLDDEVETVIKRVSEIKKQVMTTLAVVGVSNSVLTARGLIQFLDGIFNVDFSNTKISEKAWNKYDLIRDQIIANDTDIVVEDDLLKLRKAETEIKTFSVATYPHIWTLSQMSELIGDMFRDTRQFPYPFLMHYGVYIQKQANDAAKIAVKSNMAMKQLHSPIGKYIPDIERECAELEYAQNCYTTSGGSHQDQSAGYYSGGGFSVRNRVRNFQPATLQLPNIKAGCGGIDIFTGGFSFINNAQLVNAIKSIGSSAISYGFMLAMKTFAPSVQSVLTELQDMANKVNQHGINSCEMAATLVGGAWPKSDIASSHVCASLGSSDGMFKSWIAAKHECGAGGKRSEVLKNSKRHQEYQSILVEEFNVAWEVIKHNSYLISDTELAHLCMTISGTIVSYKIGNNRTVITYPSKVTDDLIKCLFEGGVVSGYGCTDTSGKCLKIQEKQLKISSGGFATKVGKMLQNIAKKAISDEPFSKNEIDFINKVRLPIYKLINVLTAYKRAEFDLRDFTDIICVDLIHQYITEILDVMIEETAHLKNAQVSDTEIDAFLKQLYEAKENINRRRKVAYAQMNQMLMVIETATIYEKKLDSTFETLQRNDDSNRSMR